MGAAASIATATAGAAASIAMSPTAAGIIDAVAALAAAFGTTGPKKAAGDDVVSVGLNSVFKAAEAVMHYVRVYKKIKEAEAFFKDRVVVVVKPKPGHEKVSSSAHEKVEEEAAAAASVKDGVVKPAVHEKASSPTHEKVEEEEAAAPVKDGFVKSVCDKASAAMDHLHRAASSAFAKFKAAAAMVSDGVIKLVSFLLGREKADAASREVDRAGSGQDDAAHVVVTSASDRVAGFGQHLKALPPPSSSAMVTATAPGGGAPALHPAVVGDSGIPEEARSCICVVVAAAGIGLEAFAAAAAAAAAAAVDA